MEHFNWVELVGCIIASIASYFAGHKVGSKNKE